MTRGARTIRFVVIAAVALYAVYLVAANVFLSSALFETYVDGRPEKLYIRFERAWTLFPEHVSARKLTIRGRDSGNEWWLRFERVEFNISMLSLRQRVFKASNIRANGVDFRFRRRPETAPTETELKTIPAIPGFPAYTLRAPRPPEVPGAPEPPYRKITLDLRDINLDGVRDVWVQHRRFVGRAHVAGRFYFKPKREIEVGRTHVALLNGRFSNSGARIADSFGGSSFDLAMARFNLRTTTSEQFFAGLTLATDVHANIPDASRVPGLADHVEGPLELQTATVRIVRGRLDRGSELLAMAPSLSITTEKHRIEGLLRVNGSVEPGADGREQLSLDATLTDANVWIRDGPSDVLRPLLHAPTMIATGDARALDLTRALTDLHLVVDVPESRLRDAGKLSHYIPEATPAAIERGGAWARLRFEAWLGEKRGTASARLRADELDFRLARMRVHGRGAVGIDVRTIHFDTRRLEDATIRIHLTDGTLASVAAPDRPLARVNEAELIARGAAVDLADPLRDLNVSIAVPSADVVSGSLLQAYLPKGSEMKVITKGSRYALNIDVTVENHLARGMFRMHSHVLKVAFRQFDLGGHLDVRARVHNWRWAEGDLALDDARVEIDHVTMTRKGQKTPDMNIARIGLAARSPFYRLADPLARVHLTAWFEDARVRDPATMNSFLRDDSGYRFEGHDGSFHAWLDLDFAKHSARGTLRAGASKIGVGGKILHLRADTELFADFVDWDRAKDTMAVRDARIELRNVTGRIGTNGSKHDLSLGRFSLAMQTPKLDLARPGLHGSDFALAIEGGEIPDVRALRPMQSPKRTLELESGAMLFAANIRVSHAQRSAEGSLEIGLPHTKVRLRDVHMSGDFGFRMNFDGFDPDRRLLDVSGTRLAMREVAVSGTTTDTEHWHGDVVLPRGFLRLGPEMQLDTALQLHARDARPLLAILFEGDLPKVLARLTNAPNLSATGRLIAGSRQLALLDLAAEGGGLRVRGSYAVRDRDRSGALVVKKSFVSVGVRVDNSGAHPRLFGLNGWLDSRSCAVDALVGLHKHGCPP